MCRELLRAGNEPLRRLKFQITKEAPTSAFSLLKAPASSVFMLKALLYIIWDP